MTTEEKARAYDEALKDMMVIYPNLNGDAKLAVEHAFPELAESEDERIRKFLLDYAIEMIAGLESDISRSIYDGINGHDPESEEELAQWQKARAYLEKHKESLHISETCKENADSFTDEDERIRRTLVEYFGPKVQLDFVRGVPIQKIRDWLEKQKEKSLFEEAMEKMAAISRQVLDEYEIEEQKEQKPVDKFQEYLNASPAERRKMNMDEILGDNKGHQKTPDALTTDSNKEADTSDCKYKNLDDIAQEYIDGVKQYNPEPTWDLMQTAVCYGYHYREEEEQKPEEWSEEDEKMIRSILFVLESYVSTAECEQSPALTATYPTYYKEIDWLKSLPLQLKEAYKDGFQTARHATALTFMNYLDENRPDGKMGLSNGECEDIDKAFKENDWAKIIRYIEKYSPSWKPSEVCYGAKGDPDPAGVWKPSEEQMEAFRSYIKDFQEKAEAAVGGWNNFDVMIRLFEQLKKLM